MTTKVHSKIIWKDTWNQNMKALLWSIFVINVNSNLRVWQQLWALNSYCQHCWGLEVLTRDKSLDEFQTSRHLRHWQHLHKTNQWTSLYCERSRQCVMICFLLLVNLTFYQKYIFQFFCTEVETSKTENIIYYWRLVHVIPILRLPWDGEEHMDQASDKRILQVGIHCQSQGWVLEYENSLNVNQNQYTYAS